jgi:hypothetical protein
VGPRARLDISDERKILVPARIRTPHCPAHSTVTILITLYQHHALIFVVMNLQIPLHDRQISRKRVTLLHNVGCYTNTVILKLCSRVWDGQKESKGPMRNETEGKFDVVKACYQVVHKPSFAHPLHPPPPLPQITNHKATILCLVLLAVKCGISL